MTSREMVPPWCPTCGMLRLNGDCLCNRPPPEPSKPVPRKPYRKEVVAALDEILPDGMELSNVELTRQLVKAIDNAHYVSMEHFVWRSYKSLGLIRRKAKATDASGHLRQMYLYKRAA